MGFERAARTARLAALALLTDARKERRRDGQQLRGRDEWRFIPVRKTRAMIEALCASARCRSINWKPGPASAPSGSIWCSARINFCETISAIIADEMAIGVMNNKTRRCASFQFREGCRWKWWSSAGLLGSAPIMAVNRFSSDGFIRRGGRSRPLQSLRNLEMPVYEITCDLILLATCGCERYRSRNKSKPKPDLSGTWELIAKPKQRQQVELVQSA